MKEETTINSTGINRKRNPKISIVIPVYNTENLLPKCLDSIIKQTYANLEIIIVNDSSPGDTKSIVDEYSSIDSRIKYTKHEKNKGLFHARITGSELATGDFIAFVDSDDYVSIDYYRLLIEKAISENADIVEGRIIRELEDGHKFIQNNNNILFEELNESEISDEFFAQEGLFYHWHVIWNKIYRKDLWDKCLPFYKKQTEHLIMTEDLSFSSLLFCNAKKYCSIKYDGYFYYIRAEASTGSKSDINKFIKNFKDMGISFDFVESYLQSKGLHLKYGQNLYNWKKRYFRLWATRLKSEIKSISIRNRAYDELKRSLKIEEIEYALSEDYYHSLVSTPWESRYENIKLLIANDNIEYISFDIFDTLVVRPFFDPRDLLYILDEFFHNICPNSKLIDFSTIRIQAEERVRHLIKTKNPAWQDVNLDEIYNYIYSEYNFHLDIINKLKEKEIELELQFTHRRDSVYELYKMALELNKKIVFISDMYLPKKVIEKILHMQGYIEYSSIYVSSEVRLLKHTGDMYRFVIDELGIEPNVLLHIGDNWNSDKVMAEKNGCNAFFYAKSIDLLLNRLSDKESGNSVNNVKRLSSKWINYEYPTYFGVRCMLGMVANKIFDNPYISFNADSDFNIDPYFIGYYALGMHTFSLCKWIIEDSTMKKYNTIHFMARDGYLPYNVYNTIARYYNDSPKANYFYASRRSLLPHIFMTDHNKFSLSSFVSIYAHTPASILELFNNIVMDNFEESILEKKGIILCKKFSSNYEFKKFIDILIEEVIDYNKVESYEELLKSYFSKIVKPNDAIFDLGYSARLQTMIVDILGRPYDTYFVHTNSEVPWIYSRRNEFSLNTFYETKPQISGILREQLFAELGPSCIGYKDVTNGVSEPIFENYYTNQINRIIIKTMHTACIDFSRDMVNVFKDYLPVMKVRNRVASIPLEMYIHNSKQSDRSVLMHSYSDDSVHGAKAENNILNWWNIEMDKVSNNNIDISVSRQSLVKSHYDLLLNHNRISKLIFYMLFDRDTLKKKVKNKCEGKPKTYKFLSNIYGSLRSVKRMLS